MGTDIEIRTCGPRGPEDSTFVIVGEAPGKEEIKANLPFVGPSGTILNHALEQLPTGSYPEPYITNTYKSLITQEKDPAYLQELALACRPALLEEIGRYPRRIIIASGAVALMALTGDTSLKITRHRGKLFPSELASVGIIAALHPAFLLRGNGSHRQFLSDILHGMLIARGGDPIEWKAPTWSVVSDMDELQEHIDFLKEYDDLVAGDTETSGFSHLRDHILSHGYTWTGDHVYILNGWKSDAGNINVMAPDGNGKLFRGGYPNLVKHCAPLFQGKAKWGWHNGKFDARMFSGMGIEAPVDEDSMLLSYALDEQRGIHDLETVAGDWLNSPNWKAEIDRWLPNKRTSYDKIPWPVLFRYQAYDIANTYRLIKLLRMLVDADKTSHKQYFRTLIPASAYLKRVELKGIYVDQSRVAENKIFLEEQAKPYIQILHEAARRFQRVDENGAPSDWSDKLHNSHVQLAELIFDHLRLKNKMQPNRTVRSTADDNLDKLVDHPVVLALRQYRKIAKALGTYVKPYTEDPEEGCIQPDGRIHTSFLIHGTATGRLASRDPNIQNIPRDPMLRGQFVAPPGRMLIEPDLNQAELRSLAILSGDPELCRIYLEGKVSLHERVRNEMYGSPKDWTPADVEFYLRKFFLTPETRFDPATGADRIKEEQKMRAKNVNFGIIYGITEVGLAEQTGENPRECTRWLETWAKTFPIAWNFIKACRLAPLRNKNLVTVFGYRKRFHIISPNTLIATQNEAANMPHQSTASTITLHGGMRIQDRLAALDAYIVNTVHDSLIIEAPLDYTIAKQVTEIATHELEQVPRDWGLTQIPFQADAEWGLRWGSLGDPEQFAKQQGWIKEEAA